MSQQKTRATTLQQKFGFQDADLNTPAHDALMVWLDQNVEKILLQRYPERYPTEWQREEIDTILAKERGEMEQTLLAIKTRMTKLKSRLDEIESKPDRDEQLSKSFFDRNHYASLQKNYDEVVKMFHDAKQAYESWSPGEPPARIARVAYKTWESPVMARNGFMVGFIDMKVCMELNIVRMENGRWCEHEPVSTRDDVFLLEIKPTLQSVGELIRQIRMYQQYQGGTYIVVSPDNRFADILAGQGIGFVKAPGESAHNGG